MENSANNTQISNAYINAGVNIELANKVKSQLPQLLALTKRKGVIGKIGGFGGLFALNIKRYKEPVLVSSVDGVGTKLKIAFALGRHDTIGQDLVNHCVNDIAVLGAEPLFFLDYIAMAKLDPDVFIQIIKGLSIACHQNHCALIGGETAQMPGFYAEGEYDIAGTIVGIVERKKIVTGKYIRPGDVVIGLQSNGLHTNGYSLVRRIFLEQQKWSLDRYVEELGCTLGEEFLRIHRSYGKLILKLLQKFNGNKTHHVKAFAHITGGGFYDNIPRVLPKNCKVIIKKGSWPIPPIFSLIQRLGKVQEKEMYHVFNMGIGMIAITSQICADEFLNICNKTCKAWIIGEVKKGEGTIEIA